MPRSQIRPSRFDREEDRSGGRALVQANERSQCIVSVTLIQRGERLGLDATGGGSY